jgi:taurine transport system substrate-binding protein
MKMNHISPSKSHFNGSSASFLCLVCFIFFFAGNVSAKEHRAEVAYGGSSWLGHYPVWIGIKEGIFSEKDLIVRFKQFHTSSARLGAMLAGDVDFASTGSISAIALMAAGVKSFYALGTQDSYATVEGIIVRSGIRSPRDLKGKKIGVTFASSAHVLVLDVLEQNGLDAIRDVKLINLRVSEMPAAFQSGQIDACAAWTPIFHKILAIPGADLLLDDTEFSLYKDYGLGPGPDLLVVRKEFVEQRFEVTKAFIQAYFEGVELLQNHPETCAKALIGLTGLSFEDQMEVLKDIKWFDLRNQFALMVKPGSFVIGLQKLADFLKKKGQIDRSPKVNSWVNPDLLSLND